MSRLSALLAQVTINQGESGLGGLPTGLGQSNVTRGLTIAYGIAGGIGLIVVVYGGLKFILSQGNPQEVTKAKNTIVDGLIGLAVVVLSGAIIAFVMEILN